MSACVCFECSKCHAAFLTSDGLECHAAVCSCAAPKPKPAAATYYTAFGDVTDEQLRAECERRRLGMVAIRDANGAYIVDHDHFRIVGMYRAERDEWKQRAQDAEERLKRVEEGRLILGNVSFDELARELRRRGALVQDLAQREVEPGTGIASLPEKRPDNSVAFLDEDLLCEDA
jgi:hypothetical protein